MAQVILVVCDGLGDRPVKALSNKTPLDAARKPNLDYFAKNGITGLMHTIRRGVAPGSDTSHLAIFGYDPEKYYFGRGPFEAMGAGFELKEGDVAFRGNFATVDSHKKIIDRRAGRPENNEPFAKAITGTKIGGVTFFVLPGVSHRAAVVMRGKNLSSEVTDSDPHIEGVASAVVKPLNKNKSAVFTSNVLNKFLEKSREILSKLPENAQRIKEGKPPANCVLVRGAGMFKKIPSFFERYKLKAACIAGGSMYKGVARSLGMEIIDVVGATGTAETNLGGKFKTALQLLSTYDFVFVHVKATDVFSHDGNYWGKMKFIEKIDSAISVLKNSGALLVVTGDHSTSCELKEHTADPLPIMISGPGVRIDDVKSFSEHSCASGALGHIRGLDLMPELINLLGKTELYGE
jgi:2,3-bisphosphoglycerate-independent phosphoglycerate mutase